MECKSFQEALCEKGKGYFNKIHMSNLGDWMTDEQFLELAEMLKLNCSGGTKICYRYLQKNHFFGKESHSFSINYARSEKAENNDRFPFYGILDITLK